MKITPINDRVVVTRLKKQEKTAGGIILPTANQEQPNEGVVQAVGRGRVNKDGTVTPVDIQVGDQVTFSTYAGTEVTVDGSDYVILREEDVLGVFIKEAKKSGKTLKAKK